MWFIALPGRIWRGFCRVMKAIGRWFVAQWRLLLSSPRRFYQSLIRKRDWILAKVEYLQSESGKWRTAFTIIKMPYTALRACGLNPQAAAALLVAGSTAGTGVIVNETILSERSFANGDSGVYSAPLDIPVSYVEGDNTLKIDLGTTPVGEITIQDVTVGTAYLGSALPAGQTNAVMIGGSATSTNPAFSQTFLEVGSLTFEKSRCTQLKLEHIETHRLNVIGNASDGQSIAAIPGTPRDRAISGGNRADEMSTSGGVYDQIRIGTPSSGVNGKVDTLILTNIYSAGGPCILSRIKAGEINIILNEIGAGNGLVLKDFIISTTTSYKHFINSENVEVLISPPTP